MANSNLKTLSEIFNGKIFRMPDYQRGYSWSEHQLEDLWRDIDNLPLGKPHYTGMITVDKRDNKTYHVIDGQQRLTSLIIFLKNILDRYEDEWISDDIEKKEAIKKYIFSKTKNSKNPKIIFGYYENNSSFYFYKTKILDIQDKTNDKQEKTLYIENLAFAKKFFYKKLQNKTQKELEELFIKITEQLKFNWYEIERTDDLDENVIFETMNNRGKPLSVLEILKNRLIYITTLLDFDRDDKEKLRNDINKVWKTIFEYLGKDKRIEEDEFLKYHIAMYWGTSEVKNTDFYRTFLLDEFFAINKIFNNEKGRYKNWQDLYDEFSKKFILFKNLIPDEQNKNKIKLLAIEFYNITRKFTIEIPNFRNRFDTLSDICALDDYLEFYIETSYYNNGNVKSNIFNDKEYYNWYINKIEMILFDIRKEISNNYLHYDLIESYISSLQDSIKSYYYILNPHKGFFDRSIIYWLNKLNIMDIREFTPILLSAFNNFSIKDKNDIISILKSIENYLFVKRYCWGSEKTQYLNSRYYQISNLYENLKDINSLIFEMDKLIYQDNKIATFKANKFIDKIKEKFEDDKGYYSWIDGLKYVLYEYEIYLKIEFKGSDTKVQWEDINRDSIEHILPQNIEYWNDFKGLKKDKLKKYLHSLGNLLLLSKHRNSKISNKPFDEKKEIYSTGSFSEIEVSRYKKWTTKEIDERSEKILKFMNKRWNLGLKDTDIKKLK